MVGGAAACAAVPSKSANPIRMVPGRETGKTIL
jgi:hypothetical protein